ncbi:hypothetical protein R3W88_000977 [Solanum pinnatisectum]|uniref:F-box associated beta-propeller type 3 domain-containing protein n=1 Tax=Solanum pinnatisectum TaxID=50273 RepID=A0AAV9MJU4_9SOLN|nr:hypothetical protein R3W88_000977 [Solanum pinnatisectum]
MMVDGIVKKYPEDMVIHILLGLLVKFILRFKSVSKTLYTLIQSSSFINIHYNHTLNSTYDNIKLFFFFFLFISNDDEDNLNTVYPDLDLINSSHGLIALMEPRTTIVFNTSTRHYKRLPPRPFQISKGEYQSFESGGFGYDSVVNDFKVFRISEVFKEDGFGHINDGEKRVEVYELGIDIWRKLDHVDQQLPKLFWLNSSMSYKGCYHWIASFEGQKIILCFDMTTEIFRNIQMPDTTKFTEGTLHSLLILNESLSLICYPSVIDPNTDFKKYTIIGLPTENPLVMWKDYVLLFQSKNGYLMSYDLKQDEIKELNKQGYPKSMRVIIYYNS